MPKWPSLGRAILFTVGGISLATGIVGIFVPLLPTTPFLLLAAWCFARSSDRARDWLNHHPQLGPIIRNWKETGSINRASKILASLTILVSIFWMHKKVENLTISVPVALFLLGILTFLITRPLPKDQARD
ncbi:MAG: YbaN family protein [Bdellovibrionales bacterium]